MEARFIVLEGIDGAGTTSHTERLARALVERGIVTHPTREPSDGSIGRLLREVLTHRIALKAHDDEQRAAQLALLFAADRLDHVGGEIVPQLAAGSWVLSDRYDYSSIAYQSVTSESVSIAWLRSLNRHARRPDLTIVLDVPAEIARERRLSRAAARELFEDDALQVRLAHFYADIERHFPEDRIVHIDANRPRELVFQDVLAAALSVGR